MKGVCVMKAQNENGKKTMTETGTQTQNDVAREKKDSMSLLYVVFCGSSGKSKRERLSR